jgi:hypothetical protein
MKTAVSIPGVLFEAADQLARRLRVLRSRLFATALAKLVAKDGSAKITERLDALYAAESSPLSPAVRCTQRQRLIDTEW